MTMNKMYLATRENSVYTRSQRTSSTSLLTEALPNEEYLVNVTVSWKQGFTSQHLWEEAPDSPDVYCPEERKGKRRRGGEGRGRGGDGGADHIDGGLSMLLRNS